MDGDDSGVAFSDAEHDILDDEPQMSLQQFHQMQQQYLQQQQKPQKQKQDLHHHRKHTDARLSIHSMLSPSPDEGRYS